VADLSPGASANPGKLRQGGAPGGPNPAEWYQITIERHPCTGQRETKICDPPSYVLHTIGSNTQSKGTDASPPVADKPAGSWGQFSSPTKSSTVWLQPAIVQECISHARANYLAGNLADAMEELHDYQQLLSIYDLDTMSEDQRHEFDKQSVEITNLLQRLASNLDYFGNPAGYAPLLSLETNLSVYQNELSNAIPLLYLSYWLKAKEHRVEDKVTALQEGVGKLSRDTSGAISMYNSLEESISNLQVEATNVANDIKSVTDQIDVENRRLMAAAQQNVEARHRLPPLQKALAARGASSGFPASRAM
jgi:hypothetical protein